MSLFFDLTKISKSRQLSGLTRVSHNLKRALVETLGDALVPVVWCKRKRCFTELSNRVPLKMSAKDHFITPEIFCSDERAGYYALLEESGVRSAAVFHDAIPLNHPGIIWPKSVSRHPLYMRDLARLNHVFSVSMASQEDLIDYWDKVEIFKRPQISTLVLGADFFDRSSIPWTHVPQSVPLLLNIGIIEPRKNQEQLLDAACRLWDDGIAFELCFVGRINPHFGKSIETIIKHAKKAGYPVQLISKQSDEALLDLYSKAHFTVFNSIAEGFGLPVVESLWLGLPCITSRLPSLGPFIDQMACISAASQTELQAAINQWLTHPEALAKATSAAQKLTLPTWQVTAESITDWMKSN